MSKNNPFRSILDRVSSKTSRAANKRRRTCNLNLETLEDRLVPASIMADFNNDGFSDLVTSDFRNNLGEVRILYGKADGFGHQTKFTSRVEGDAFGFSLAHGDLNGDGHRDLAVGAPNANQESGVVYVYYGRDGGLSEAGRQIWHQNIAGMPGDDVARVDDHFGFSLAIGNFNGHVNHLTGLELDDLAIGTPGKNGDSGAVYVLNGGIGGLTTAGSQFLTQSSLEAIGDVNSAKSENSEGNDMFGFSLAAGNFNGDRHFGTGVAIDDLAIGSPGEEFDGRNIFEKIGDGFKTIGEAFISAFTIRFDSSAANTILAEDIGSDGYVHVVLGAPSGLDRFQSIGIRRDDVNGTGISLASGDFDNDGLDDLVIGNRHEQQGSIDIAYGSTQFIVALRENSRIEKPAIRRGSETRDNFGLQLAVGDTNGDGFDELVVSDTSDQDGRGAVMVFRGGSFGLSEDNHQFFRQSQGLLGDLPESRDFFGREIALGDINNDGRADLVVKVSDGPNDSALNVLYGSANHLTLQGSETYNLLSYIYAKDDPLRFTVDIAPQRIGIFVESLDSKLQRLQEQHGFRMDPDGFFLNFFGFNEKWFRDRANDWWIITPNGDLYKWNGVQNQLGTKIESLDPSVYDDPNLLFQAGATFVSFSGSNSFSIEKLAPIRYNPGALSSYDPYAKSIYIAGSDDDDVATVTYDDKGTEDLADDELKISLQRGDETIEQVFNPYKAVDDGQGNITYEKTIDRIIFEGKAGDDQFTNFTSWDSYALGGTGNDVLKGGSGNDVIVGGAGHDLIDGSGGNDDLRGDDWQFIENSYGHDTLYGGGGENTLRGGAGNDALYGGADNDTLSGGRGNDVVYGQGGADLLGGETGNDSLFGGDGNDTLVGGLGNDEIHGEDGIDRVKETGHLLTLRTTYLKGSAGDDVLDGIEEGELHGTAYHDVINADNFGGRVTLIGGAGNDFLHGGHYDDKIYGGAGNDTLQGDYGHDSLYGGLHNDVVDGWGGDDFLSGGYGNDTLLGRWGNDRLFGDAGIDSLDGSWGNDYLDGGNDSSADRLVGGPGWDTFVRHWEKKWVFNWYTQRLSYYYAVVDIAADYYNVYGWGDRMIIR